MTLRSKSAVLLLLTLNILTGLAQETRSGPPASPETIALPELRKELLERRDREQAIRKEVIASGAERPDPKLLERMRAIDEENTERVKAIVREHGWPGPELIGRDGTSAAWLIVQHSTHEFQVEMLPLVKEAYLAGKLSGSSYALLQDRVLVHQGKPQIYGSQGRWENGVLGLQPIEDEANVDRRRAEVGLGPLADYLEGMRKTYRSKEPPAGATTASRESMPRRVLPNSPYARLVDFEKRSDEALAALETATDPAEKTKRRGEVGSLLQQLAWARSVAGDHEGALAAYRRSSNPSGQDIPPSAAAAEKAAELLQGFQPVEAVKAIVEAARDRQIVILNEAHHVARHRAFALLLARELRKAGFQYLACEGFSPQLDVSALRTRGYPNSRDGFYLGEPLFADFVRESLKLGYIPVAYEHISRGGSSRSPADSINEREAGQAGNLMERIFRKDPGARVFLYVGYSHLMKKPQNRPAQPDRTVEWMACRLQALSGIEPLTIDQVAMTDPAEGSLPAAVIARVFPAGASSRASVVMRREAGSQHLVIGTYAGDADLQVFHPPTRLSAGRPDWLSVDGHRQSQPIPTDLLPKAGRRLVQAFAEGEREFPVALDQVLVTAGADRPPLFMLPPGSYRFAFEE